MRRDWDVVIIGGGPAGSLCASLLRRQCPQLRVLIVERATFPRHHVGEACLPGWATVLSRAGVLEAAHAQAEVDKLGFIFNWGAAGERRFWTADFRDEAGNIPIGSWHVDRAKMDTLFLDHAISLGACRLQPARVTAVKPLDGPTPPPLSGESPGFAVTIRDDDGERTVTAGVVVDASGQARLLARQWSLPTHRHPDMNNYAVYGYWRGGQRELHDGPLGPREQWAVVSTHDLGWVWHIPIGPDLVSVGLVTDKETLRRVGAGELRDCYLRTVNETARVGELLEGARFIGALPDGSADRLSVIEDWAYRCDQVCGAGWYVVGDGAMFVDPILSSGLTLASTGASMVANAITTLAREPATDAALLRRCYQEAYQDISSAYHRMARVWYKRNARSETWHWQAKQERLRTSGGAALFEDDADAFTAVCLGAISSPLDAALPRRSEEVWGSEYFTWMTNDRLFGRAGKDDQRRSEARGIHEARTLSRRSLMSRWQRLVGGRVRLRVGWQVAAGYHTSRFMDEWLPIRYVSLPLEDPLDPHLRVACPAFDDCPEGIFPALDGKQPLRAAVVALLGGLPLGTSARDGRLKAITETLLQLDMLGLLDVTPGDPPPRLGGHPLLTVVANAALRALGREATVYLEVDWLGECIWLRVVTEEGLEWLRLYDRQRTTITSEMLLTETTAARWARRPGHWMEDFAGGLMRRLARLEQGPRAEVVAGFWSEMRAAAGLGVAFDHVPGQPPAARPL
jgi:flavin-dependent dehydrogenase